MGTARQGQSSDNKFEQQTTFAPRTQAEQDILNQFAGLGQTQLQLLNNRLTGAINGVSPYALDPASQQLIDQMQASDQQQLNLANKEYADFLSGGRGMRMSDTPISEQAITRQGLGQSALLGQYANTRLNAGLLGNQFRSQEAMGLAGSSPSGLTSAFVPQMQERLASGTTRGFGAQNMSGFNTQPLMQTILQGMQGAGQLAAGIGTAGMGFGGFGLIGGGGPTGAMNPMNWMSR